MRSAGLLVVLGLAFFNDAALATRLKDMVSIEGVRDNQLAGYGLVVGLNGTGDRRQTVFSAQSLANLLQQMGVAVPGSAIRVNNVAAVMVTATLPPFAQPGAHIDVTVSAIGDATNLQGGQLVLSSLKGVDGQVYALAQGALVTGGFATGRSGTSQTVNHPTAGRIPNGATVERPAPTVAPGQRIRLQLRQADFTTASRIAAKLNENFKSNLAVAENSGVVNVAVPQGYASRATEFVAQMEVLQVEADRPARVVVNERTGTIVMGKDVHIAPVAVMHGALSVEVQTTFEVSQPAPFSKGATTEVVPQVGVSVREDKVRELTLKNGATVDDLVHGLMSIGSTARDIIAILQSLQSAGALEAELQVI